MPTETAPAICPCCGFAAIRRWSIPAKSFAVSCPIGPASFGKTIKPQKNHNLHQQKGLAFSPAKPSFLLQQNANQSAIAFIEDPGQRGLHLFLRIWRHLMQLALKPFLDELLQ